MVNIPEKVWAIGKVRDSRSGYRTPIVATDEFGVEVRLAPLTVLDADGERALPVYTTLTKARKGIENHMSDDPQVRGSNIGTALVEFGALFATMRQAVEGDPTVDYIGLDMMGEGRGNYALVRL